MTDSGVREPDRTDVLGRRVAAGLLDLLVLFVLFVAIGLLFGRTETGEGSISINLEGGSALIFFALALLYYFAAEATTRTTLGKRALGLRVEAVNGGEASTGAVAVRTLLRVIDVLPVLYLVGFIAALSTGRRQARLGDLAARTRIARR
ncbi:RDD family protein [Thermoleophilia bacterium SCSIO 60948]|nr:RDD family protein [Thermoleophilia bacterium SCSIO 60948]